MTTTDPFQTPFVDQALAKLGFGASSLLWWGAAYKLSMPRGVLSKDMFVKEAKWHVGFFAQGGKFPYVDLPTKSTRQFQVSQPLVFITVPTNTSVPSEAWTQGKPRAQIIAGLLNVLFAGPLVGRLVWEGIVEPTPNEKLHMSATVREIEAENASEEIVQNVIDLLPKLYERATDVRLSLALRWFHRGWLGEDQIGQFSDFWLSILSLIEGYRYDSEPASQRVRFRAYASQCQRLEQTKQKELVQVLSDLYDVRNKLFHESDISVVSPDTVERAQLLALRLLRAEFGKVRDAWSNERQGSDADVL